MRFRFLFFSRPLFPSCAFASALHPKLRPLRSTAAQENEIFPSGDGLPVRRPIPALRGKSKGAVKNRTPFFSEISKKNLQSGPRCAMIAKLNLQIEFFCEKPGCSLKKKLFFYFYGVIRRSREMTKYIFVTGGVVSGLGKGIVAASLGRLLKMRGYNIFVEKFDPYLNVDPGTMNPN